MERAHFAVTGETHLLWLQVVSGRGCVKRDFERRREQSLSAFFCISWRLFSFQKLLTSA